MPKIKLILFFGSVKFYLLKIGTIDLEHLTSSVSPKLLQLFALVQPIKRI